MRKILSSLMLLTLAALFAATYVCGIKAEDAFKAQVEQLNQNYAGMLQVELLDYQRGFLVSEVKTVVSLKRDSLPLQHQIRHFPWKVRMLSSVAGDSEAAAELAALLPIEQLQLQTDVTFDGSSESRFALAELNFSAQQAEFILQGLRFNFATEGDLSGGQLSFQLENLQISEPGKAEVTIADVQFDSRFVDSKGVPLGDGTARIGTFSLQQGDRPGFALNGLHYRAESSLENEQLASLLDLNLDSLLLGGETFTDGKLQLQISGIDMAAVREMQTSARQLRADMQGQQIDPLILQLQLLGLYSQLLQAGLTVSLPQLSLLADEGLLLGKGAVELQGANFSGGRMAFDNLDGQLQLDIDLPIFKAGFRMLSNLKSKGQSSNPAVLNEQAEQLAGGLVQKGILARRGDGGYRLNLALKQGRAELNGQPFRL